MERPSLKVGGAIACVWVLDYKGETDEKLSTDKCDYVLSLLLPVDVIKALPRWLPCYDGLEPGIVRGINLFFLGVALVRAFITATRSEPLAAPVPADVSVTL